VHQEDIIFRSLVRKPKIEGVHLYAALLARIAVGFPKAELARISGFRFQAKDRFGELGVPFGNLKMLPQVEDHVPLEVEAIESPSLIIERVPAGALFDKP